MRARAAPHRDAADTSFIDALTGVLDPAAPRLAVRAGPTTSVVRRDVNVADERRGVVLLDTPGLPLPESGTTRSKALRALTAMVEDRLSRVLAEESKVVRRKSDGGELVHLRESEGRGRERSERRAQRPDE